MINKKTNRQSLSDLTEQVDMKTVTQCGVIYLVNLPLDALAISQSLAPAIISSTRDDDHAHH